MEEMVEYRGYVVFWRRFSNAERAPGTFSKLQNLDLPVSALYTLAKQPQTKIERKPPFVHHLRQPETTGTRRISFAIDSATKTGPSGPFERSGPSGPVERGWGGSRLTSHLPSPTPSSQTLTSPDFQRIGAQKVAERIKEFRHRFDSETMSVADILAGLAAEERHALVEDAEAIVDWLNALMASAQPKLISGDDGNAP